MEEFELSALNSVTLSARYPRNTLGRRGAYTLSKKYHLTPGSVF